MIIYHFDLYPRDDPKNGARLVRFTNLQSAEYRAEANGTGSGRFSIRADDAEAAFIDPRGLQYVRVVEEGVAGERVVGGFWLGNGDFEALNTNQTRLLTFGGPGTIAYLGREVLWSRAYQFASDNIVDESGTWHFYNQASIAGGDFLGGVLVRLVNEGLSFASPVTEDDDKPDTAILGVVFGGGLGYFNDSAANVWTIPSGEFKAQTGDTILSIVRRLMEAGLYIEMHPDTFALHVWERGAANSRGQIANGAAWGAGVIRFQAPTDGTVPAGNIKSDLKRAVSPFVIGSTVLAGANGTYVAESDATVDVPWHRYYSNDAQDADTLSFMADSQLTARGDAADSMRIRFKLGNDPANGEYHPFDDYDPAGTLEPGTIFLNDTVTVHTGTGQWDYNEDNFPVAALTVQLRPGGDWDGYADLGSTYTSMAERAFQARGVATHNHPPNPQLCPPAVECSLLTAAMLTDATDTNGDVEAGASTQWTGGAATVVLFHGGTQGYGVTASTSAALEYDFGAQVFTAGVRYVLDVWLHYTGDHLETTIRLGESGGDDGANTYTGVVGNDPVGLFEESEAGADGNTWHRARVCWTPSATRTNVRFRFEGSGNGSQSIAVDDLALYTTTNNEYAGTSPKAARCDHGHHARDIAFSPGAVISATTVQAAIEEVAGGTVVDHGALLGLNDDDHTQYVRTTLGGKDVISVVAASGPTETLDLANGNHHAVTLTDNCTLTLTGATNGVRCLMTIRLIQDGTGSRTVTWPASVEWVGGDAPTLQTGANTWDLVTLLTEDGGTTWFAQHAGTASGSPSDRVWMPLTTVVSGVPELVWDADNSLIPTEVPI